jgi:hypothetical protein
MYTNKPLLSLFVILIVTNTYVVYGDSIFGESKDEPKYHINMDIRPTQSQRASIKVSV